MGQYFNDRKIGTCESMYYMRRSEAQELARLGAKDNDGIPFKTYLTDNVTRWRFPWPAEDLDPALPRDQDGGRLDLINTNPYDGLGFLIPATPSVVLDMQHADICVSNHPKLSGVSNVNIFIPCPYSEAFRQTGLKTSTGGAGATMLRIVAEADREDPPATPDTPRAQPRTRSLYTIFACARCDSNQRFSHEDVANLKEHAREYYAYLNPAGRSDDWTRQHPDYATRYADAMSIIDRLN